MTTNTNMPKTGLIAVIALIVLVAAGGGYYFFSQKGMVPPVIPLANQVTEGMFADIKDPLIRKHFVAQYNQKSFRITSESSDKSAPKTIMEIQTGGDSMNYKMTTLDNKGKEISQFITIKDVNYARDYKDNKWWKEIPKPVKDGSPLPTGEFEKWTDLKKEFEKASGFEYTPLGKETCGNLMCYKYQEANPQDKEGGTRTFWFDDSKLLQRREESVYGSIKTNTEYSYDNISISAPSPTKDVPEGHSIYEYMFGNTFEGLTGSDDQPKFKVGDLENAQKELEKMQKEFPIEIPDDFSGE